MDALSQPFNPVGDAARPRLPFSPGAVAPFLLLFAVSAVAALRGWAPPGIARPLATAGFHGALLGAALASAWGRNPGWRRPAWLLAGLVFVASLSAQLPPWGVLAHLLLPLALWALGRSHPQLRRIGWSWPEQSRALLLGAGVGLFFGTHLLLSASRTFGYPVRPAPLAPLFSAMAYDAGANVVSAELFFRGVIFNFCRRRSGFWVGALLSTGACLVRYMLDPALPRTLEVLAGALFYLALLSLASCALFALSGSVLPSVLAMFFFFGAYRLLQLS